MASEYEFRLVVGAMIRKNIRTILESERFVGRNIRWMEEKRWLESVFRIRGEFADAKAVESRLDAYTKRLNAY